MGLGAPKNRVKLSRDPNNTAWSNSTEGYGHRILSSQGWKTGDYLGAQNAAHADTYTAANASHVRVALREDGLGLGAKVGGKSNAETFGLSTLSSIFGRLNGKSDEDLEKQQKNLRDAELRTYQAQKHGFMNFVRGGLLVGDKIEEFPVVKKIEPSAVVAPMAKNDTDAKMSKKRKAGGDDYEAEDGDKQKKEKKRRSTVDDGNDTAVVVDAARTEGKLKKRKEWQSEAVDTTTEVAETAEDVEKAAKRQRKEQRRLERASRGEETSRDEKSRLKQEKRARKEDRRKRKEEKRRAKAASDDSSDSEPTTTTTTVVTTAIPTPATSEAASGASTPVQAAPMFSGGRHAIRQRYIMQKRMASMDPRALNEILMIKAQV
ncbi:telomerase inhibitor [Elasticomyces elasticus]|nr:telomerase inhibitor [Elasticomyces elasticus]